MSRTRKELVAAIEKDKAAAAELRDHLRSLVEETNELAENLDTAVNDLTDAGRLVESAADTISQTV